MVDLTKEATVHATVGQLWRGAALVALVVLAVAAILPNVLPKKFTIATQTFVEESVGATRVAAEAKVADNAVKIEKLSDDMGMIRVKVETVQTVQIQARASQEADRVTRGIHNGDQRVQAYTRIYEAGVRNMKANREPLDGVTLE